MGDPRGLFDLAYMTQGGIGCEAMLGARETGRMLELAFVFALACGRHVRAYGVSARFDRAQDRVEVPRLRQTASALSGTWAAELTIVVCVWVRACRSALRFLSD